MNILVACEESQRVTIEMRKRGHNAFSCDVIEESGGYPQWHIKNDVIPLINGHCNFLTEDGKQHFIDTRWDMVIAFPPCTHLAVSGARHFKEKRNDGRQRKAIEFFCKILTADCDKIAVENPVNIISGTYIINFFPDLCKKYNLPIKPSCKIQPYFFGDKAKKTTCLWLKGLPNLIPTNIVEPGDFYYTADGKCFSVGGNAVFARDNDGKILRWNDPETAKIRSKTFPGIAKAIAEQWG